jgi:hypothetical protein
MTMKNAVFWDVGPCGYCVNWCFGGTYRLHLQSRKIRERATSMSRWLQLTLVPRSRIFLPWRWRRYVPPKRRFTQDLHCATSQKTAFFMLTFVDQKFVWILHACCMSPTSILLGVIVPNSIKSTSSIYTVNLLLMSFSPVFSCLYILGRNIPPNHVFMKWPQSWTRNVTTSGYKIKGKVRIIAL